MGERLRSDRRTGIVENWAGSSISSLARRWVGRELSPFLYPRLWEEEVGPQPCPFTVRFLPGLFSASLSPSWTIHASHATSRGGRVGWTDRLASPPSRPLQPFPDQLGKPPPYLEGVSRTPPRDLIAGSQTAGMARGCVAPECTPGMGAATRARRGVRDPPGRQRALPISGSHGGWRHFWKPEPPGPASGPRGGPREDQNKKATRVANEAPSQMTHLGRSHRGRESGCGALRWNLEKTGQGCPQKGCWGAAQCDLIVPPHLTEAGTEATSGRDETLTNELPECERHAVWTLKSVGTKLSPGCQLQPHTPSPWIRTWEAPDSGISPSGAWGGDTFATQ